MDFLDNLGMKAERKRLSPFFAADERFIQTDVCELVAAEVNGARIGPFQAALSFTNKAVFFRSTKNIGLDVIRIPYERVFAVVARGPLLEFTTFTGGDYLFRDLGKPMGDDKYVLITAELSRRENHRQVIELPDGSRAELINRSRDEDKAPEWFTAGDFDRSNPANREAIETVLSPAIMRLGPIGWPPA